MMMMYYVIVHKTPQHSISGPFSSRKMAERFAIKCANPNQNIEVMSATEVAETGESYSFIACRSFAKRHPCTLAEVQAEIRQAKRIILEAAK